MKEDEVLAAIEGATSATTGTTEAGTTRKGL